MSSKRMRKRAKKMARLFGSPENVVELVRQPSIPERIVRFFESEAPEAHIDALCSRLRITREQFHQNIARARDIGVERSGLRLTPMYEHDGWWTCRPTVRLMVIAQQKSLERNSGEQVRNHRIFHGTKLDGLTAMASSSCQGLEAALLNECAQELAVSAESDWIVAGVSAAVERGDLTTAQVAA